MPNGHPLTKVERLIAKIEKVNGSDFYLCAIDKKLTIRRSGNIPVGAELIASLSSKEVTNGVAPWKWQSIEDRIRILWKKGKL